MLVRIAVTSNSKMLKLIPIEVKTSSSIEQEVEVMSITVASTWLKSIISYIKERIIPTDKKQARRLKCQVARYTLIDGVLYRRGYTLPLL